jgi:hypothetical protein
MIAHAAAARHHHAFHTALPHATNRLLQARMLADAKAEMKEKRAQLLASMRELPDYSLQVSGGRGDKAG